MPTPIGEGAGYRPAHVRNGLAPHTGGDTQDEARAALHGVRIPQALRVRSASRGAVHIARLTRGRSPATLAVIRSEADPHVTAGRSGSARPGAAGRDCAAGANAGTLGAVLEAPALVAGLDDVAVVGEAIEQRRRSCPLPGRSRARAFERTRTTTEWPFARASRTISRPVPFAPK